MPLDRRALRDELQRQRTGDSLQDAFPVFSNANPTPSNSSGVGRSKCITNARRKHEKYSEELPTKSKKKSKLGGKGSGKHKGKEQSGHNADEELALSAQVCKQSKDSEMSAESSQICSSVPQCSTQGCERETWNGQPGQTCCRTCEGSDGRMHGPDCEARSLLMGKKLGEASLEAHEIAQCSTRGCSRETWNGKPGATCCRTCSGSNGRQHGPDCDRKFRLKAECESEAEADSQPARPERHIRLMEHLLSSAVQLPLPGEKVKEEPARLSPEEVERVFRDNVPGVDEFLYRFQDGNFSLQFMVSCYQNGVYKFRGTDLEDHFTWLMRIIVHHGEEGKPGCRGYLREVAEAFMDCQDIQARAIEHVGFQISGMTLDFRGLLVQLVDEYKGMAMKFLVTTELDRRGGPDDWANDPVHFENRIVADIGDALGLNAGDIRRALMDDHKGRNQPFQETQKKDLMKKFTAFFDLDVMLRCFVNEVNSFSEKSPKESIAQLFLTWVSEHMPEKHLIFDEETFSNVDISIEFGLAILEVIFLGETTSQEDFRERRICELLPPLK